MTRGVDEYSLYADVSIQVKGRRLIVADWEALTDYIRSNYDVRNVDDEPDGPLGLLLATGQSRSQTVYVLHAGSGDFGDWISIESPVGAVGDVDLADACRLASLYVCGGVVTRSDMVLVRHAVPLDNLDIDEFVHPLRIVTNAADQLEKQLLGSDEY
jgi:hypothetical protein